MLKEVETLRAELAAHGAGAQPAVWRPLDGGRTNAIWRIEGADRDLVCKLFRPGAANPLFPNDPAAEVLALSTLQGLNIAPEFYATIETRLGTCLLYSFQEGAPWQGTPQPVARLLYRLHGLAPPPGLRCIPSGTAALNRMTAKILAACDGDAPQILGETGQMPQVPPTQNPCFLHGDAVAGNIVVGSNGVRLIDWQCPATGDACEDLAIFLSPAMQHLYRGATLSGAETDDFLAAYGDDAVVDRYLSLRSAFHQRMAAYCLWKAETGATDYNAAMQWELAALEGL